MKTYLAAYFNASDMDDSWPYMVSRGALYKDLCVEEWVWWDPKDPSFKWAPIIAGSALTRPGDGETCARPPD